MLLSPGDRVDRYQVLGLLGSGGMGEVYRARDPRLQRQVALKIVRLGADAAEGGKRLLREARTAATLSHPNVLAVYDVGEVSEPEALRGVAYIAMELVIGGSLRAQIGAAEVSMPRRIGWLTDVARALDAAHTVGIIHRDVKPENVMVRADGIVKVLDFGIAHRAAAPYESPSTTAGHSFTTKGSEDGAPAVDARPSGLAGTLLYMAPEQLQGEPIDGRVDQFAWGVMAYELLSGACPWKRGVDSIVLVSQILSREPPPLAEIDPRIPRVVSDVVMRALEKSPARRFSSMAEVLSALDRGASAPGVSSAPVNDVPQLSDAGTQPEPNLSAASRPRNRPGALWAMRVAALCVAGATLFFGVRASRAPIASPASSATARSSAATADACTSSAECSRRHGGEAWRCQGARHECVPIASEDCKALAEPSDLTNDETIWIGALYPTTGPEADRFVSESNAIELARKDFATALGGSATSAGTMRARPIAVALCDETIDPTRAARHLAEDVEVPATIGFRGAATARSVIPGVFLLDHVLSFIAIAWASDLTKIPEPPGEPRLVWRATLDASASALPLAALVSDVLEPRLRATPHALRDDVVRVAVVRPSNAPVELSDLFFRALRFNGKTALENGDDFRQFVFDPTGDGSARAVVDAMASFAPNVVLVQGATSAPDVIAPLEQVWKHGRRPYYVIHSDMADDPDIRKIVSKDPDARRRFIGLTNETARLPNAALVMHYNLAFPHAVPIHRTDAPQPSYDAFYTLAYAAYALGDAPVTGPALSRAIGRLVAPGTPIDVGPDAIFDAFSTLRAGGRVDLNGALGSLELDPTTGEAPVDFAILCLGLDDRGPVDVESGLVYDSTKKAMTGTMHCL